MQVLLTGLSKITGARPKPAEYYSAVTTVGWGCKINVLQFHFPTTAKGSAMSDFDPDYLYLPTSYEGSRPTNRRVCQHFERGTIYAIPKNTTMHMDMMRMLRTTKDEAYADAAKQDAGAEVSVTEQITEGRLHSVSIDNGGTGTIAPDTAYESRGLPEFNTPGYWAALQDRAGKDRP